MCGGGALPSGHPGHVRYLVARPLLAAWRRGCSVWLWTHTSPVPCRRAGVGLSLSSVDVRARPWVGRVRRHPSGTVLVASGDVRRGGPLAGSDRSFCGSRWRTPWPPNRMPTQTTRGGPKGLPIWCLGHGQASGPPRLGAARCSRPRLAVSRASFLLLFAPNAGSRHLGDPRVDVSTSHGRGKKGRTPFIHSVKTRFQLRWSLQSDHSASE